MRNRLHRRRGVVLIMVVAIIATLAIAGTAFVMVMGQESKAASSTLYLAQAELAARSGLEHAIGAIDESMRKLESGDWLAVTPDGTLSYDSATSAYEFDKDEADFDAGWHRYFEPTATEISVGDFQLLSKRDTAPNHDGWVSHYFGGQFGAEAFGASAPLVHEMRGRELYLKGANPNPPPAQLTRCQYAVCVTDLDGKLHANIARWTNDVGTTVSQSALVGKVAGVDGADIPDAARDALILESGSSDSEYCSISEIARRAGASTPTAKYALERFFTTYPVAGLEVEAEFTATTCAFGTDLTVIDFTVPQALSPMQAEGYAVRFEDTSGPSAACYTILSMDTAAAEVTVSGDCSSWQGERFRILPPRPAVNVNTAPEALLAELFKPIPSFADAADPDGEGQDKAEALAKLICERRPIVNRHELEDLIFRVVANDDGTGGVEPLVAPAAGLHLTERQFNDVLNSTAGVLRTDESAFDEPLEPGIYSFDGWEPYQTGEIGPSQLGGSFSAADGTLAGATTMPTNVTWSTELKFNSRFFHIYVIGRAWHETGESIGVKRLHAIYDAEPGVGKPGKIVWLRWNLSSRGSLTDM